MVDLCSWISGGEMYLLTIVLFFEKGWTRYGYYCYMAGSETKTFDEAKQMCEKAESQLVDVSSRLDHFFNYMLSVLSTFEFVLH